MSEPAKFKKVIQKWVSKAEHDLEAAERLLALRKGCPFDVVCFHAQQAVEKYIKALLLESGVSFSKTHDLSELRALLPQNLNVGISLHEMMTLTPYAVEARYPGEWDEQDGQEALEAVRIARKLRDSIRRYFPTA